MSEYDDYDDQSDDDAPQPDRNPLRAQLRKMEKELKTLREENEAGKQAARQLEFAKAGVPLDDPKARYFIKGYDGDLTADAIKAAAAEIGLVEARVEQPEIPDSEKQAHQRIADPTGQAPTARDFGAEIDAATSEEDVLRIYREAGGLMAQ